jgi:hypothetical protein
LSAQTDIQLLAVHNAGCERQIDVVFVHGLGGDVTDTWKGQDSAGQPTYWPRWVAEDFPHVGVWVVGYPTTLVIGGSQPNRIPDLARQLIHKMLNERIEQRPFVMVTHSLGGLLAKQLLHLATHYTATGYRELWQQCVGVAFLGTPHGGAKIASMLSFLKNLGLSVLGFRVDSANLDELKKGAPALLELNMSFQQHIAQREIDCVLAPTNIVVYRETKKLGGSILVVDEISANPNIARAEIVNLAADHLSICKLADRQEAPFQWLRRILPLREGKPYRPFSSLPQPAGIVLICSARLADEPHPQQEHLLELVLRLRRYGINAVWEYPLSNESPVGWPVWRQRHLSQARTVLLIGSQHNQFAFSCKGEPEEAQPSLSGASLTASMVLGLGGTQSGCVLPVLIDGDPLSYLPNEFHDWFNDLRYPSRFDFLVHALCAPALTAASR